MTRYETTRENMSASMILSYIVDSDGEPMS